MGCPDRDKIDLLVAGALAEEETRALFKHVSGCPACRREAAFSTAVRLALPLSAGGAGCLSDEVICLLRDDQLPEGERESALNHLAGCQRCLGAVLALDAALEETQLEAVLPPQKLVDRAIAVGADVRKGSETETKSSRLKGLFEMPTILRVGFAAATAAGIFLVTVLLLQHPQGPSTPEEWAKELVAHVEEPSRPALQVPPAPPESKPQNQPTGAGPKGRGHSPLRAGKVAG